MRLLSHLDLFSVSRAVLLGSKLFFFFKYEWVFDIIDYYTFWYINY